MNEALDAFGALVDYEVAEVTAAATFYMAEVYADFSRALVESERPTDLDAAGMQDYELVLEEEAFPFEEQAIEVHEKNVELMVSGLYNPWIEKSLARLAELMPGRYAKFEESSGWITAIDQYAYRAPTPPIVADETAIGATPVEPEVTADETGIEVAPVESEVTADETAIDVAPVEPEVTADETAIDVAPVEPEVTAEEIGIGDAGPSAPAVTVDDSEIGGAPVEPVVPPADAETGIGEAAPGPADGADEVDR